MFKLLVRAVSAVVIVLVLAAAVAYGLGYWAGRDVRVPGADATNTRDAAREAGAAVAVKAHDVGARARDIVEDGALTAKIKSKMALDDHVKALSIDVDTADGVVRLTGTVQSQQERERALALARETDGVKEVRDGLVVRSRD